MKKYKNALQVYLFKDIYDLHKQGVIRNRFIIDTIREMKENGETFEPIRRRDFERIKRELGEGGKVLILFPDDLHEWYASIYENTKRGLWVRLNEKLLDKLQNLWYNILHQSQ